MPSFRLRENVFENVLELRHALGSATRALSRDDLASMIAERHRARAPNGSSVQRWEEGREPDYESARIMADLAGVSFEDFCFGKPAVAKLQRVAERPAEYHGLDPAELRDTPAAKRAAGARKKTS